MEKSNGCVQVAPKIICDGEFEIIKLTKEYHEEAVEIFLENFTRHENLCIATNLRENKDAFKEIELLFREALKDGVSFAAQHIASHRLASLCINKIVEPKSNCNLDEIFKTFTSPQMVFIGGYLDRIENSFDFYKAFNIDCSMEVLFLSTRPEFGGKGLARSLTLYSIEFARNFGNGLIQDEDYPEHIWGKRPKVVISTFTSKLTQRIGEKLGFETIAKIPYADLVFNGCTLAEKLDPIHEYSTFAIKNL